MLTNDIVSFEQPGPEIRQYVLLKNVKLLQDISVFDKVVKALTS